MKTIEMSDILELYKKCDVNSSGSGLIRNTLNLGTLNNNLNTGSTRSKMGQVDFVSKNNTVLPKYMNI